MAFGKGLPTFIPTFTFQPKKVAEELVLKFKDSIVVDLGAGGRRIAPWVKTVDFQNYPETDYVCDFVNGTTPFDKNTADLVIATGVLEHVEDENLFMAEIGGRLAPRSLSSSGFRVVSIHDSERPPISAHRFRCIRVGLAHEC